MRAVARGGVLLGSVVVVVVIVVIVVVVVEVLAVQAAAQLWAAVPPRPFLPRHPSRSGA
jgi:hypothetical protein